MQRVVSGPRNGRCIVAASRVPSMAPSSATLSTTAHDVATTTASKAWMRLRRRSSVESTIDSPTRATSALFAFPGSWFLRLFGPIEAAARLPAVLYLIAVFAGVIALLSDRRAAGPRTESATPGLVEAGLIWLALGAYFLALAFSDQVFEDYEWRGAARQRLVRLPEAALEGRLQERRALLGLPCHRVLGGADRLAEIVIDHFSSCAPVQAVHRRERP